MSAELVCERDREPTRGKIAVGQLLMVEYPDPNLTPPWETRFVVERADPVIECTAEWLAIIECHMMMAAWHDVDPRVEWRGAILTFNCDVQGPIIYRQVAYDHQRNMYTFAWPD